MKWRSIFSAAVAAAACVSIGFASERDVDAAFEPLVLPDSVLTDQHGVSRRFRDEIARDHRLVITFQFTGCLQQCPISTVMLAALDGLLSEEEASDVKLISITLDPLGDTSEKLLAKATEVGASDRWLWLTGDLAELDTVYRALGAGPGPKENHNAFYLVGDGSSGRFTRVSGPSSPEALAAFLRSIDD